MFAIGLSMPTNRIRSWESARSAGLGSGRAEQSAVTSGRASALSASWPAEWDKDGVSTGTVARTGCFTKHVSRADKECGLRSCSHWLLMLEQGVAGVSVTANAKSRSLSGMWSSADPGP